MQSTQPQQSSSYPQSQSSEYIDLQQYWLILKRRWLPATIVFGSAVTLTALATFLQKPVYQAEGKLLFKEIDSNSLLSELEDKLGGSGFSAQTNPLATEAEVVRTTPIVQKVIAELQLKDHQGNSFTRKRLLEQLEVKDVKQTDVLQLSYKSTDPREAAAVINQLMKVYLENNILTNRAEAIAAREFIEKQLPKTEATVRQAEAALRKFKEQNNVVALEKEAESAVEVVANLEDEVNKAEAQLAEANTRTAALRNKVGMSSQAAIAVSDLSQSPGVQKVLNEFQQVEGQLAVARSQYQEAHPTIKELKNRQTKLRALLKGRVGQVLEGRSPQTSGNLQAGELKQAMTEGLVSSEVDRLGLASQVAALSNKQTSFQKRIKVLPKLEQSQRELARRLEAAQSTYETLLQKLQETRVVENQNVGNARIIEPAFAPEEPVAPRKSLNFAIGGLLGGLLAVATALLLEARDNSIKTVQQARELFEYTLLGTIPVFGGKEKVSAASSSLERAVPEVPVRDQPRSMTSEAYRMLQANLSFSASDNKLKVIVVTSSVPKEGKSTVSANLAVATAQLGHRVLLVDADLRRPSQHQVWELPNNVGLSNVIAGKADLKTAIKKGMANLDVLTSGVLPPNPVALLNSKRMAALIECFSKYYDYVIIDTPPIAVAADAPILGKMADGVLVVVRPEVTTAGSAATAKEFLKQSGQNILGLVVNGVVPENEPDSYYYYYAKGYYTESQEPTTAQRAKSKSEIGKGS